MCGVERRNTWERGGKIGNKNEQVVFSIWILKVFCLGFLVVFVRKSEWKNNIKNSEKYAKFNLLCIHIFLFLFLMLFVLFFGGICRCFGLLNDRFGILWFFRFFRWAMIEILVGIGVIDCLWRFENFLRSFHLFFLKFKKIL